MTKEYWQQLAQQKRNRKAVIRGWNAHRRELGQQRSLERLQERNAFAHFLAHIRVVNERSEQCE